MSGRSQSASDNSSQQDIGKNDPKDLRHKHPLWRREQTNVDLKSKKKLWSGSYQEENAKTNILDSSKLKTTVNKKDNARLYPRLLICSSLRFLVCCRSQSVKTFEKNLLIC